MLSKIILLLCVSLLTACSLGGSVPRDHYYRIAEINITPLDRELFTHIVIKPVKVSGLLHERAILYVEKLRPLELQRYHYHFWAQTPANLVQQALGQAFSSSLAAGRVSLELGEQRADLVVDSRLLKFERQIDGDVASIEIELEVSTRHRDGSYWSRTYRVANQLDTLAMHDSAQAFSESLQQIMQKLIDDIQSTHSQL